MTKKPRFITLKINSCTDCPNCSWNTNDYEANLPAECNYLGIVLSDFSEFPKDCPLEEK